jgi:hypothetical protein
MNTRKSTDDGAEPTSTEAFDHRAWYDGDAGGSLGVAVVTAVCEALDAALMAIEPLCRTVDPDALDDLFGGESVTTVSFHHEGCSVTVRGDEAVLVTVLDDRHRADSRENA